MIHNFNISYSAISCFKGCQRNFYYGYVAKVKPGKNFPCWGNAGNAVHTTLEYANSKTVEEMKEIFTDLWDNYDLSGENKTPFNTNLKYDDYWNSILLGLSRKYDIRKFEEKFEYKDTLTIKGFVDVIASDKGILFTPAEQAILDANPELYDDNVVIDWKTNTNKDDGQINQLKFYAYLYHRRYNKLPKKFILDYVKAGQRTQRIMTMKDVEEVKEMLINFFNEVSAKTTFKDWSYDNSNCFFCAHKDRCKNDMVDKDSEIFEIEISQSKFKLLNPTTVEFDNALDKFFSYPVSPDPVQQAIIIKNYKAKWGKDWDGRIKLKKRGKYGLGLLDLMRRFIMDYADYTGKHVLINIMDKRKTCPTVTPLDQELRGLTPYWYQLEAVDKATRSKHCIIKVPTSGGKTVIAAEFFRRRPSKTLFVVDRNVLLTQTIKEFENVLDMKDEIGSITGGVVKLKGNMTVASVQTIATALNAFKKANKRVKVAEKALSVNPANPEFKATLEKEKEKRLLAREKTKKMVEFLQDVDTVIIDECHVAKSESYNVLCENIPQCHFRIGLSGTPGEDDWNHLELFKNIGSEMYEIKTTTLIEEGTIMKPTINFVKYDFGFLMGGDYNDRLEALFDNEVRNNLIFDICEKHKDNVRMIIVHRLAHGNLLLDELKARGKEAVFIQGSMDVKTREEILDDARNGHSRIIIGTSQIISKGLNLKPLRVLINATGNAGDKQTIQSLGRVLRNYEGKDTAICYDFIDEIENFKEHSQQRIKAFEGEGHEINIIEDFYGK